MTIYLGQILLRSLREQNAQKFNIDLELFKIYLFRNCLVTRSPRSYEGGNVVRFSGFARETNYIPLFCERRELWTKVITKNCNYLFEISIVSEADNDLTDNQLR